MKKSTKAFATISLLMSSVILSCLLWIGTSQTAHAQTTIDNPVKLGVDFGIFVTDTETLEYDFPMVKEMGATWVRMYLPWMLIEKQRGEYHWEEIDAVFEHASSASLNLLPVVYGIPEWAAIDGCGPISDTQALNDFLTAVLNRYSADVDVWEFINEPDGLEPQDNYGPIIGCWGPYPEEYANQLGVFHTKVQALDPGARVVYGGLAYDSWDYFSREFLTNTLQHGAGQFFNVANIHYYPINYQHPDPDLYPTLGHKVADVRDTMSRHGVQGKDSWVTETSDWVNEDRNGSQERQKNFIVKEFTRAYGEGADNIFWFAVKQDPWEVPLHRWLINQEHKPDNGFYTFQHLADKLTDAVCTGPYPNVPADVEAYQFFAPGRAIYVLWANTTSQTVALPASVNATLTDRDGKSSGVIPVQNDQVTFKVGLTPVFLEVPEMHLTVEGANDTEPALSPDNQTVVFISDRDGQPDVFSVPVLGEGELINLTQTPAAHEDTPVFSPDGSTIAFASDKTGDWDIYLMNADGTNLRKAIGYAGTDELYPSFSPDGQILAFSSNRADGNWDIYVAAIGSNMWIRLTNSPAVDRFPDFAVDGTTIAFRSERDGNSEIYIMDSDGTNLRRVTTDAAFDGHSTIIPNSGGIVFVSDRSGNRNIYMANPAGESLTTLEQRPGWQSRTPRVSRDGRLLVYAGGMTNDALDVYVRQFTPPLTAIGQRGLDNVQDNCDWEAGTLAYGWSQAWYTTGRDEYLQWTRDWIYNCISRSVGIDHVNDGLLGYAALTAYEEAANPVYLDFAQQVADYLMNTAPRTADGTLVHEEDTVWVDTLLGTVPFLVKMSEVSDNSIYLEEAITQVINHANHLQDSDTGLYHHAWDESENDFMGPIYWERGNGWALLADTALLSVMTPAHPLYPTVLDIAQRQAAGLNPLQDSSGLWHTVVNNTDSYTETSGSALIGYAFKSGVEEGWLDKDDYSPTARTAILGVWRKALEDGTVTDVSGPTWPTTTEEQYITKAHDALQLYGQGIAMLLETPVEYSEQPVAQVPILNKTGIITLLLSILRQITRGHSK